jgi:hypothetical protein
MNLSPQQRQKPKGLLLQPRDCPVCQENGHHLKNWSFCIGHVPVYFVCSAALLLDPVGSSHVPSDAAKLKLLAAHMPSPHRTLQKPEDTTNGETANLRSRIRTVCAICYDDEFVLMMATPVVTSFAWKVGTIFGTMPRDQPLFVQPVQMLSVTKLLLKKKWLECWETSHRKRGNTLVFFRSHLMQVIAC